MPAFLRTMLPMKKSAPPAPMPCPQCGEVLPSDSEWCPRCVGESFFKTDSFTMPRAETDLKQVGRYRIVELLGEGGFGRVYRALESGALEREVALKVIKPGLDSRPIIERFNAEKQTLMLLDHPNIARVLDAGTTEDGRPFFVMEMVEGLPLNEFIQAETPPLEARLRLFLQICAAVEHAHAKGVIHRDLKPANILVTWPGGLKAETKATVIDFGIAKALFSETAPHTGTLGARLVLGTPEYMSPEQAESGGAAVDTRSDVFSLGALLFEMLTGTPPIDAQVLRRAALPEVLRMIQEHEPPRPSTRMKKSGADLMARRVADELDWVVLKAMSKERERRYQTTRELEEDVRRFLENDTVQARPPSLAYLGQKFVRRHLAAVAAVLVAVLSLAAVAVFSLMHAEREKEAQLATLRTFSESDTVAAHDRAREGRYAEAVALLGRALRSEPGNAAARARLLALLAQPACAVPGAAEIVEEDLIEAAEFLPDGSALVTRSNLGQRLSLWKISGTEVERLQQFLAGGFALSHAISPDGRWLAAGTNGGICRFWETATGVEHGALSVSDITGAVRACAFSEDGSLLFAGGTDPLLTCIRTADAQVRWTRRHDAALTRIAVSPRGDCVAVACEDGGLLLLDPHTGEVKAQVKVQSRSLAWLYFIQDGAALLAGGGAQEAMTIDPATGKLLPAKITHWNAIRAMVTHESGYIAHASDDLSVRLCTNNGRAVAERSLGAAVSRLVFSPESQTLRLTAGTASTQPKLFILEGQFLKQSHSPLQFESSVRDIDWHPDLQKQSLVVVTDAREAEVLDTRPRRLDPFTFSAGARVHQAWLADMDRRVVALREDGLMRRWGIENLQQSIKEELKIPCGTASRVVRSADRVAVLSAEKPGHLSVVDSASWKVLLQIEAGADAHLIAMSPAGDVVVVADRSGWIEAHDLHGRKPPQRWKSTHGMPRSIAVTNAASLVVTGHGPGIRGNTSASLLCIRDGASGAEKAAMPTSTETPVHLSISADGTRVISGGSGRSLDLWELPAGSHIATLEHVSPGRSGATATFSSDSRRIFSGNSFDRRLRLWDARTGRPDGAALSLGQDARLWSVSQDGQIAIAADGLQSLSFWHLGRRLPLADDLPDLRYLVSACVSADGSLALAARSAGEIHLFPLPPATTEPLPECFLRFAEAFGRWRAGDGNVFERVPFTDFDRARREVLSLPEKPADRLTAWMKWLASDPETRARWPQ